MLTWYVKKNIETKVTSFSLGAFFPNFIYDKWLPEHMSFKWFWLCGELFIYIIYQNEIKENVAQDMQG